MKKQVATTNLNEFKLEEGLEVLLKKAKLHNRLNLLLQGVLPKQFKGITLCLVEEKKVTLIALNSALAYRAEKQINTLLAIVKKVEGLSQIKSISVKVDKNKY